MKKFRPLRRKAGKGRKIFGKRAGRKKKTRKKLRPWRRKAGKGRNFSGKRAGRKKKTVKKLRPWRKNQEKTPISLLVFQLPHLHILRV